MKLYKIIFGLSFFILIAYILFLGFQYQNIEQNIPTHYSGKTPDSYGDKAFLWLEVGINTFILIFIGCVILSPQKAFAKTENYLENSQEQAIKNRQILLSVLGLISTLLLCGISFYSIN